MVKDKMPDPEPPEDLRPEPPELELTDEEKAIDADYQRRRHEHTAALMRNVGTALQSCASAPVIVIQRVRKDGTEYHAPSLLMALAAYLQSGPSPIDPLAHKAGRGSGMDYSELIRGLTDALGGIVMSYTQSKSPPPEGPAMPQYPPGYTPPGYDSPPPPPAPDEPGTKTATPASGPKTE